MFAIFKRELKSYFTTSTGFIFMSIFLFFAGIFFSLQNIQYSESNFTQYLDSIWFLFLFVIPILTMRLMTEEKKQRTDQLLLTCPITVMDIVLGKFFAAVALFLITLGVTVLYTLLIAGYGSLEIPETVGAYLGFILLGSSLISIGLFISTTTENQVVAAVLTFFMLLLTWLMDFLKDFFPVNLTASVVFAFLLALTLTAIVFFTTKNSILAVITIIVSSLLIGILYLVQKEMFYGLIVRFFSWFSLLERRESFSMGILKLDNIVYYLSFISYFLFLTIRLIDKRRWD